MYGGLQDNSSWLVSRSSPGGIASSQWENTVRRRTASGVFVDPTDPTYIYAEAQGGYIGRINRKTHEVRDIKPLPNYKEGKLRFNWNTPIHVSPTRNGTIYIGSQFLHRSTDFGQTWERVSPDLSTNDPDKQKQEQSGGVTVDNSSAELHTTSSPLANHAQSVAERAGTEDGNLKSRATAARPDERRRNVSGFPGSRGLHVNRAISIRNHLRDFDAHTSAK